MPILDLKDAQNVRMVQSQIVAIQPNIQTSLPVRLTNESGNQSLGHLASLEADWQISEI
jgi:hypothetical protein